MAMLDIGPPPKYRTRSPAASRRTRAAPTPGKTSAICTAPRASVTGVSLCPRPRKRKLVQIEQTSGWLTLRFVQNELTSGWQTLRFVCYNATTSPRCWNSCNQLGSSKWASYFRTSASEGLLPRTTSHLESGRLLGGGQRSVTGCAVGLPL